MGVSISGFRSLPGRIHIFGGSPGPGPAPETQGGSLFFDTNSWLEVMPEGGDMYIGTQDFTVEWYQYQDTSGGNYSRVFSVGVWPEALFSVSVEPAGEGGPDEGTLYFWGSGLGEGNSMILSIPIMNWANKWTHFAVCRVNGTMTAYQDGMEIGFTSDSSDLGDPTGTIPLIIGNELGDTVLTQFHGNLTNFHLVLGIGLYTGNFTPPTEPLSAIEGTSVLMISYSEGNAFNESMGHTVDNAGETPVTWQSLSPFPL